MHRCKKPGRRAGERGFSIIELMISIVIGMVVVGAVFAAYLGMGTGSRNSRAMAQMTEDVSLAMNLLRSHVGMAGFSTPTGVDDEGKFIKNMLDPVIVGCSSTFDKTDAAIDALQCSKLGSDAVAVRFEADKDNAIMSGTQPLDCLGNTFGAEPGGFYLSYSRFYVSDGQLFCRGPGNAAAAALVENIEDMKVWYGFAANGAGDPNSVAYYARGSDDVEISKDNFNRVISARICLVVRSEGDVMDSVTSYVDCEGNTVTPTDRRMYRAFTSTIVLQNRMGTN
jgi:type IV pilus assembly protein PilW